MRTNVDVGGDGCVGRDGCVVRINAHPTLPLKSRTTWPHSPNSLLKLAPFALAHA